MSLHSSICHIVGNHMSRLLYTLALDGLGCHPFLGGQYVAVYSLLIVAPIVCCVSF